MDPDLLLDAVTLAVEDECIKPCFQPIVRLRDDRLSAFEVLARWNDPNYGVVPPSVFIPAAETAGVLDALLASLIRQACRAAVPCSGDFTLSFNASPMQLLHPKLPLLIRDAVSDGGFPLSRVNLEITEAAVFQHRPTALQTAERIRSLGMGLIMDDFGTGFSSLTRLNDFPFTGLKIDVSFIRSMQHRPQSRKIVSAVLGLGRSLGLTVVAEGMETRRQASALRKMGCVFGQGYLYHEGLTPQELAPFLASF